MKSDLGFSSLMMIITALQKKATLRMKAITVVQMMAIVLALLQMKEHLVLVMHRMMAQIQTLAHWLSVHQTECLYLSHPSLWWVRKEWLLLFRLETCHRQIDKSFAYLI